MRFLIIPLAVAVVLGGCERPPVEADDTGFEKRYEKAKRCWDENLEAAERKEVEAARDEISKAGLKAVRLEWVIGRLKGAGPEELRLVLGILEPNAAALDEKLGAYFWTAMKAWYYSDIMRALGASDQLPRAVKIVRESGLGKELHGVVASDIVAMGSMDVNALELAVVFGKAAVKPLLEAVKKPEFEAGWAAQAALGAIKDPEAQEALWEIVTMEPDHSWYAMKAYINSGGKPPPADVARWLTESDTVRGHVDAATEAAKHLVESKSIGEGLVAAFERGTGDEPFNFRAAQVMWFSQVKEVRDYLQRVLADETEPEAKRNELLSALLRITVNEEIKPEAVRWILATLEGITKDSSPEALKSTAQDVLDRIK